MGLINKRFLLTLNQRVQGSGPCAPTNQINDLIAVRQASKRVMSVLCPR